MPIFKAYDIRGVVPEELSARDAHRIGRATAHHLGARALAVGRDARSHSPELAGELIRGIREEGVEVVDLGVVSTPMLYYAVDHLGLGGGIMVTASHNPGQYNGFKICREHAIPVGGDSGLAEIEGLCDARAAAPPAAAGGGLREVDVLADYLTHLRRLGADPFPSLRVAIDCGNGMAGVALVPLLEQLPLEVEGLYFEPDGTFPNHEADPLKRENLEDVIAAVRRTGADFGVAFDGDADRAIFVDEQGEPVTADLVTALLAGVRLEREPGGLVLYDLRSSRATAESVEEQGGRAGMCRVGHSFIKKQMREEGAVFAGELSGHFYFRFSDTLVADDGLAAFVTLASLVGREGRPLSELVAPLRRYAQSGEINRRVDDIEAVLKEIEALHRNGGGEISHLDGLLVRYPTWWFNLRASNTEPVIRLNLEADTAAEMERERDGLLARIGGS